jgi:hypothetical protein
MIKTYRKQIPCSVDGCPNWVFAKTWCITHYSRARKHGDPNVVLPHTKPPVNTRPKRERWEEKVRHADHSTDGCCIWTGAVAHYGYGTLRTGRTGLLERAHRLAWEFANGPIPDGLSVLHHCDNPPCVRTEADTRWPDGHLFLGTQLDNMRDAKAKGRQHRPVGDHRHHVPRGEEMGWRVKLTESDVRAIRTRAASGESVTSIAKDFPVTVQHVGHIILGRAWKHVVV